MKQVITILVIMINMQRLIMQNTLWVELQLEVMLQEDLLILL